MVRKLLAIVILLGGLAACGDMEPNQRHVAAGGGGGGDTVVFTENGGWQDANPDGRVERDDGSAVIDGGRTVELPGENPHPAGDNDLSTQPGKIENPVDSSPWSGSPSPSTSPDPSGGDTGGGAPGKDTGVDTDAGNTNDFGQVSS